MCSCAGTNLTIDARRARRLPGYRERRGRPALRRARGARHPLLRGPREVRAQPRPRALAGCRSAGRSTRTGDARHACVYCVDGDTPILMADGRTRRDRGPAASATRSSGPSASGRYRRYVETEVLDHWSTVKPAYRVTLEDGTELVTSGDHRFLTEPRLEARHRRRAGARQRPHLTTNNELLGTGGFAAPPEQTDGLPPRLPLRHDPRRRHARLAARRAPTAAADVHRFRLALADVEALARAQRYLARRAASTRTSSCSRQPPAGAGRSARSARSGALASSAIRELIGWPLRPSDDWRKGFLAGIFDAEGSLRRRGAADRQHRPAILDWTRRVPAALRLRRRRGADAHANGLRYVRLRGGLRERLRFFHTTDPAITRKRTIEGTRAQVRRQDAGRLGRAARDGDARCTTSRPAPATSSRTASSATTASPARRTSTSTSTPGATSSRRSSSRSTCPRCCGRELARPSWKGEHVAMGTNTDPYQWVEGRYKLMRGIWEAMRDSANPCSILTKSPLLLRDLDLMQEIAERTTITANLSIPTIDEKAWRATEPHTPNPRARMEAVAELNRRGHPERDPRRAAHAGHQRRARAGRADPRAGGGGGRDGHRRDRAAPARRGARDLLRLAALLPARPGAALRGSSTGAARTRRRPSASGSRRSCAGGGATRRRPSWRDAARTSRRPRTRRGATGAGARPRRAGAEQDAAARRPTVSAQALF